MARPKRAAKQPPPPASPGRWDHIALAVVGVALAAATAFVVVRDARHDYRFYQREFRRAVERTSGAGAGRAVPSGPQQISGRGPAAGRSVHHVPPGRRLGRIREGRAAVEDPSAGPRRGAPAGTLRMHGVPRRARLGPRRRRRARARGRVGRAAARHREPRRVRTERPAGARSWKSPATSVTATSGRPRGRPRSTAPRRCCETRAAAPAT